MKSRILQGKLLVFFQKKKIKKHLWDENDFFLITYADTIIGEKKRNFLTLNNFLRKFCKPFTFIHILPFFPYSSDDGFAVVDYKKIEKSHGEWSDFQKITSVFKTMVDLVINHCSSQNDLFKSFF